LLRERTQKIVERLEKKIVELSETNQRLEDIARLRREFLQNVSHELATPMTPVVGYLRLLLNEELGPLTDLQRKCLGSIETSTQRLRTVVDTLLDVSSLETGRMHYYTRPYDFREVAVKALDQIRPKLVERDVTLVERIPDDPMPAQGDPDKLMRAMVHVLDNASKFTPTGGDVAVEVRPEGDEHLLFAVSDSGPGVRPEHIARIMEPFYQVDGSVTRDHGGVGLGLAFARRVTEALGGGIEISSPPAGEVAERQLSGTLVELRVGRLPERPETPST
jgi:signal transduction histidine kinase